jgi:hypothetical protein
MLQSFAQQLLKAFTPRLPRPAHGGFFVWQGLRFEACRQLSLQIVTIWTASVPRSFTSPGASSR